MEAVHSDLPNGLRPLELMEFDRIGALLRCVGDRKTRDYPASTSCPPSAYI